VASLYVEPEVRGEGIGGELLDALIGRERRAGFTSATVWLPAESTHVRHFYEMHRWAPDQAHRVHPASGAAEVRYRIAL
jgi:GNAT superfamily N-acetyltransferase